MDVGNTEVIADTAAAAAVAQVEAEQAQSDAAQAVEIAEETQERQEEQWTISEAMYLALGEEVRALAERVAAMESAPEPESGEAAAVEESGAPVLKMENVEPPKKERRTLFRGPGRIRL